MSDPNGIPKSQIEKLIQKFKDSGGIAVEEHPDGSISFRPFTKEEKENSEKNE